MWATIEYKHKNNKDSPFIYICAEAHSGAIISKKDIREGGKEKLRRYKREFLEDIIYAAQLELQKLNSQ